MSIPNASKYVIIGAGIHGLSTAYHLALELKKRNLGGGEDILVINALSSSSSQTDGKNKETVDHRGESIMKKSRYSLALHPESW